jgi:hypothetical protein
MEQEEGQLGYVKYSGELVRDGYLDARKSAQALLGVDEAVRFKSSLFLHCKVYGRVSREDDKGHLDARRPRIIFTRIESLESDDDNHELFKENT